MTVVRSLVTKLGFKVDKTGIQSFEKSIIGFKARITSVAGALVYLGKKTLDYFDNISIAARDTKQLADNAHLATSEFVALRRTFQDFQLKPEQFDKLIERLAIGLSQAKRNFGEIFDIARKTQGKVNLLPFAQTGDVKGALFALLEQIKALDEESRLAVTRGIFGEDYADFQRITNQNIESIKLAVAANKAYGDSYVDQIPKTEAYRQQLVLFYKELNLIKVAFVNDVLPDITKILQGIREITQNFFEKGFLKGTLQILKENINPNLIKEQRQNLNLPAQPIPQDFTMNNSITINVPPGTTEDISKQLGTDLKITLEGFWNQKTREVISNNPQVE